MLVFGMMAKQSNSLGYRPSSPPSASVGSSFPRYDSRISANVKSSHKRLVLLTTQPESVRLLSLALPRTYQAATIRPRDTCLIDHAFTCTLPHLILGRRCNGFFRKSLHIRYSCCCYGVVELPHITTPQPRHGTKMVSSLFFSALLATLTLAAPSPPPSLPSVKLPVTPQCGIISAAAPKLGSANLNLSPLTSYQTFVSFGVCDFIYIGSPTY